MKIGKLQGLNVLFGSLVVATGLGFAVLLPTLWLKSEVDSAREQAKLIARAESARVEHAIRDLFARFERATGSVTSRDIGGDGVALAARLLRAEAVIAPASGLIVFDARGKQIGSATVATTFANVTPWWTHGQQLPLPGRVGLIGCGGPTAETSGWVLMRSIGGVGEGPTGVIASTLSDTALRTLLMPQENASEMPSASVQTTGGCELLHSDPLPNRWRPNSLLMSAYFRLMPTSWLTPRFETSTGIVENISVVARADYETLFEIYATDLDTRASVVAAVTVSIATLFGLLGLNLMFRRNRLGAMSNGAVLSHAPPDIEQQLDTARRDLDEIATERDRVLAAIGHDVRTPINSIMGICALMMDSDLNERQRKRLGQIRASGQALLAMVNGMLDMAAARFDGASLSLEPIDIASLIDELGDVFRSHAQDKGLDLVITLDENLMGRWETDATRLRQVLYNLCGNAIKYTTTGSVSISAAALRSEDSTWLLRFEIADTGPGVADSEREVIFQQYKRGRDEVSRGQEGLGLGLALCREITTLLGGELTLDSKVATGSTFSFTLPTKRVEGAGRAGSLLAGRSALVVGLSENLRRRVASHLESMGCQTDTADNGFMAIGLAEWIAHHRGSLDLLLVDASLTGLAADVLMARLQGNRSLKHFYTILIANAENIVGTMEGRADAVLQHPVDMRELEAVAMNLFGDRSVMQEIYSRAPATPASRVLVVEDNRLAQDLFVESLNRAGFLTFAASNGQEAVEAVQRGGFDGILMDLQMAEVDGMEATRRIRINEGTGFRVPIIGMTADTRPSTRNQCLEAGMTMVFHKPPDFTTFPLRLREAITAARGCVSPSEESKENSPALDELVVDREAMATLVAVAGAERTAACVQSFLGDTGIHIEKLAEHLAAGRWDEVGRLAHSVAGAGGILGAVALVDELYKLEDATRAKDLQQAERLLQVLIGTWEHNKASLKSLFDNVSTNQRDGTRKAAA